MPPLVSGEWLQTQLERENVKVVDGSFYLPNAKRDAAKEFSQQRIPGATFFDMNEIRDKSTKLPRMMPSQQEFEVAMSQIGLKHDDIVIVYDGNGIFSFVLSVILLANIICYYYTQSTSSLVHVEVNGS